MELTIRSFSASEMIKDFHIFFELVAHNPYVHHSNRATDVRKRTPEAVSVTILVFA